MFYLGNIAKAKHDKEKASIMKNDLKTLKAKTETALATINASAVGAVAESFKEETTEATDATANALPAIGNAQLANLSESALESMLGAAIASKANVKTLVANSKNFVRCVEVMAVAHGLLHIVNHNDKRPLANVIGKAGGLSTPIKNALRKIIPALQYSKGGLITYDSEGDNVTLVTLDNGKVSIRPIIDRASLDVLLFQAKRVLGANADTWTSLDIVSESWKATFPNLDKATALRDNLDAWRATQIKAMIKAGFSEASATAFVMNQRPTESV